MSKQDEAMDRIRDEMAKDASAGVAALGEWLTKRLRREPGIADRVLDKGKSLAGAFRAVEAFARKNQKNGFCCVSDEKAYELAGEYYGFTADAQAPAEEEPAAAGLDLDALLDSMLG